ncbi:MAG TPA: hypothetical protein VHO47_02880 [Candidatus Babeliales bacterium]|nr:hypothetical protein [Candidatus Babeliales bacterium]
MRVCRLSVLTVALFFVLTQSSAMDTGIDFEASKKKIVFIAFITAGYRDEDIKKFMEIDPEEIIDIKIKADFQHEGSTIGRVYSAKLKKGGLIVADYCNFEGKQTKKCTRYVPNVQVPLVLEEGEKYYTMIEEKYLAQKSQRSTIQLSNKNSQ